VVQCRATRKGQGLKARESARASHGGNREYFGAITPQLTSDGLDAVAALEKSRRQPGSTRFQYHAVVHGHRRKLVVAGAGPSLYITSCRSPPNSRSLPPWPRYVVAALAKQGMSAPEPPVIVSLPAPLKIWRQACAVALIKRDGVVTTMTEDLDPGVVWADRGRAP